MLVYRTLAHIGAVWCNMVQLGRNLIEFGADWCTLVQTGALWFNLVQIRAV